MPGFSSPTCDLFKRSDEHNESHGPARSVREGDRGVCRGWAPIRSDAWSFQALPKYRWELYSYGLPDGYDKLLASDIIALLNEGLKSIRVAGNRLSHAQLKAALQF